MTAKRRKGWMAGAATCVALAAGYASAQGQDDAAAIAARAPGAAYAEFVLASYDVNGDQTISRAEFSATGRANFDEIDDNLDGVASAEEIAAWYMRYING